MANSSSEKTIVTIDGPCASGKSTAAKNLAKALGFIHVNSGAIYRKIGMEAAAQGIAIVPENGQTIADMAKTLNFRFELQNNQCLLVANDTPVGVEIATEEVGNLASKVSSLPEVRTVSTAVQREAAQRYSVVLEGRDAGTVVFPNAPYKFFLDASVEERTKRRLLELEKIGRTENLNFDAVREELAERDHRDSSREHAPTRQAQDAILVDTTNLSAVEVVERMINYVRSNQN
ncbi:MAG: (d)CMP kinase [Deltaproteobacteria bacterium]|nr:(d)CMP kinase [Deltaproteobacteria bacterium]